MKLSTLGICVSLLAACAHHAARTDSAGAATSSVSAGQPPPPPPPPVASTLAKGTSTDHPRFIEIKGSDGTVTQVLVNRDLLKQGYHTGVRKGQLVYCRSEQLTGSRFDTQLCLTEVQILDQQKQANDVLGRPRANHCIDALNCRD